MKKLFTTLIISVLLLNLTAQVKFISANKEDMRLMANSLITSAKTPFIYDTTVVKDQYRYDIVYKSQNNAEYRLKFRINVTIIGANKDLEIPGTPEYHFSYVSGQFLDLFPFWNTYIQPIGNIEELTTKGATFIVKDNYRFVFSKNSDNWSISMK